MGDDGRKRCHWPGADEQYLAYHDHEWGRPVTDDVALYEKLCLEGFQSGLSWITILRKRETFRSAFAGFDPERVAAFDGSDIERLLGDAGIVRHRGKIEAAIANAHGTLAAREQYGSLAAVVWSVEPERARRPAPTAMGDLPAQTPESSELSKASQATRLPLRRPDHGIRRHAEPRTGERPPPRMLRPRRVRGRPARRRSAGPPLRRHRR